MARKPSETAVNDFVQAVGVLVRRVRAAAAPSELSLSENSVLGRLSREGAVTTADLARAEGVKPQSMGTTVASLEEAGYVERTPHPTDGRQMLLRLTAKGMELRKSSRDAKRTWLAEAIAQLDKADQDTLFAAGEIMQKLVEFDPR
ncbi:MAG TPA: MarR family transcriptional regulator [Acidobacteriaceae bacterium]|jgi:DNA-binding MarR family transcriptional regulator